MDAEKEKFFFELHNGLPREGPGDSTSVKRAFEYALPLPEDAAILDIACGPGGQTMDLARLLPGARIVALDSHAPFLREMERRARSLGLANRIETREGDMANLPFAPASFDLIWCEGAAYMIGYENALRIWKPLLKSGGALALTEPVWLKDGAPEDVRACWAEYEGMRSVQEVRAIARNLGYEIAGDFVLPDEAWWTHYYGPMEARVATLEGTFPKNNQAAQAVLAEARQELECHRRHSDCYGYLFLVLKV